MDKSKYRPVQITITVFDELVEEEFVTSNLTDPIDQMKVLDRASIPLFFEEVLWKQLMHDHKPDRFIDKMNQMLMTFKDILVVQLYNRIRKLTGIDNIVSISKKTKH